MTLAVIILALAAPARAALVLEARSAAPASVPAAAAVAPVAGLAAAPALSPSLAAPMAALRDAPGPSAAPAAPAARPASAFPLVERTGRDSFGREVRVLDALDPAAPEKGTIAHVDFSLGSGQAQLDGPLDWWTGKAADGAPEGADLTHFREHLWFGLAVLPGYRDAGLGARLMDEAVARMRAGGARRLFIRATPGSLGFYKKLFGAAVRSVEEERGEDGDALYRLEVAL